MALLDRGAGAAVAGHGYPDQLRPLGAEVGVVDERGETAGRFTFEDDVPSATRRRKSSRSGQVSRSITTLRLEVRAVPLPEAPSALGPSRRRARRWGTCRPASSMITTSGRGPPSSSRPTRPLGLGDLDHPTPSSACSSTAPPEPSSATNSSSVTPSRPRYTAWLALAEQGAARLTRQSVDREVRGDSLTWTSPRSPSGAQRGTFPMPCCQGRDRSRSSSHRDAPQGTPAA